MRFIWRKIRLVTEQIRKRKRYTAHLGNGSDSLYAALTVDGVIVVVGKDLRWHWKACAIEDLHLTVRNDCDA